MKKFLVALAFVGLATGAFAQETENEAVYSVQTNSFWSNWFVQGNYTYSAFYAGQSDDSELGINPFEDYRGSHGFSVALGKWFTPGIGLRGKFGGMDARQVLNDEEKHSFDYFNTHADVLFNVTNMIWGYKEDRVYNAIPYVGFGAIRNNDDEIWDKTYNFGLLNTFRLNKYLAINLELAAIIASNEFDGAMGGGSNWWQSQDKIFQAELGLTVNLGRKGWKKAVDEDALNAKHDAEMAAAAAALAAQQAENQRLKDELAKKPKEVIKREVEKVGVSVPQSVFFNIGSARIASAKETVNLQAVVDAAKDSKSKVYVTGYADSATGSASYNQTLSEKRAETVASKLEELGLSRDQMVVEGKGGVDTLKKNAYNRRVIVEVK